MRTSNAPGSGDRGAFNTETQLRFPDGFNFANVPGLNSQLREKLQLLQPTSLVSALGHVV